MCSTRNESGHQALPLMKTCTKCVTPKPLDEFHRMTASVDGRHNWCKTGHRACDKVRYEANKDSYRDADYRRNYGITLADYDAMLARQSGRCSICRTTTPGGRGRFHVDHCHSTSRVRGLLCSNCNTGLGKFRDSVSLLRDAARYLSAFCEHDDDSESSHPHQDN